jgi:ligand-binding SRPBCC domain-containing protein
MRLQTETWLPLPRREVFEFFADARNLQALTPPWLGFQVLNAGPIEMRTGTVIDYQIRLHGIPIRWQSAIAVWEPPVRFVDEQRRGPYRRWAHEHRFIETDGGTTVRDDVDFEVPLGWLARPFVARDLRRIFAFRHEALATALGQALPVPRPAVEIS